MTQPLRSASTRGAAAPPGLPAATIARLLALPFAYFFHSRVPRARQKVGWALGYVLPVLALAAAAQGSAEGLVPAALMMVAVYTAYEFGYLVNDTLAIEREPRPTLRLPQPVQAALRRRLGMALAARVGVGLALIALLLWLQGPALAAAAGGWALLWPLFGLYNRWRGRITIALHFVLVSLRYGLPIIAAAPALDPAAVAPLLLLYALPSSFEAAWKPRYGLTALKDLAGGAHWFRLLWSATLATAGLAIAWARPSQAAWWFAGASLYYLLFRAGAFLLRDARRSAPSPTGQPLPHD